MSKIVNPPYFCYIIESPDKRSYNGFSNNIDRRIKQHCGILKGGAKYTLGRQWSYIVIIECIDCTYSESLSCEYYIKYPTGKKNRPKEFCTPEGRIKSLRNVFTNSKFIEKNFIVSIFLKNYFLYFSAILRNSSTLSINGANLSQINS